MNCKRKFLCIVSALIISIFFGQVHLLAQRAQDQYGFRHRTFLIQSVTEVGRSTKGMWDFAGGERDLKYKKGKWPQLQVWQRDRGRDGKDRIFIFQPAQGSAAGRYFIRFAYRRHWGINAIDGTGKVEARSRADHFELKYIGRGRWKIYYKNGMILSMSSRRARNGVKVVLTPDHNGHHGQWVFFNARTNKSFIPRNVPTTRKPDNERNDNPPMAYTQAIIQKKDFHKQRYFGNVSRQQFHQDDRSHKMKEYYEGQTPSNQWLHILNTVKATATNRDTIARRAIYMSLNRIVVKKGKNFAEKLMRPKMKKQFLIQASRERDRLSKRVLQSIADKFTR